jgi:hypothetical protein
MVKLSGDVSISTVFVSGFNQVSYLHFADSDDDLDLGLLRVKSLTIVKPIALQLSLAILKGTKFCLLHTLEIHFSDNHQGHNDYFRTAYPNPVMMQTLLQVKRVSIKLDTVSIDLMDVLRRCFAEACQQKVARVILRVQELPEWIPRWRVEWVAPGVWTFRL